MALALGIGLVAVGVTAGVFAATQYQNTNQGPPPFIGRGRGGPGMGHGGPGGPMGLLPMLGRKLQLTEAQQGQIKGIADSHRDEWRQLADRGRAAHEALNAAVTADAVDETLIRAKSMDASAVEADMAVARAHAFVEVLQILTPDQRAQLRQMEAKMKDHPRGPGPGGGGRGRGI